MLDIYGLAAAQLGEWQRRRDEAMARYECGLPAAVRPPGVVTRLAALFRGVAPAQPRQVPSRHSAESPSR
jgi:hypothetical protein